MVANAIGGLKDGFTHFAGQAGVHLNLPPGKDISAYVENSAWRGSGSGTTERVARTAIAQSGNPDAGTTGAAAIGSKPVAGRSTAVR